MHDYLKLYASKQRNLIDEHTPSGTRLNPLKGIGTVAPMSLVYFCWRESDSWIELE